MKILKSILIVFLLMTQTLQSMKQDLFCFLNKNNEELICNKYQCGFDLCSSDENACKVLNYWSTLVERYITLFNQEKKPLKYLKYLEEIKNCEPNEYLSLKKDVCSIKQACKYYEQYKQRKISKDNKCVCSSRFKYRCAKNYCTENKNSCKKLDIALKDSYLVKLINKC